MNRVLITGVGGNVAQGVLKALRRGARPYYIAGIDMEPLSAGFSLVDAHYVTPRTSDAAFKKEIVAIIKKERIEAVYVCSPAELAFFAGHKREIEALGAAVFVNSPEVVRIGSDKLLTVKFLEENGFPYPESVPAEDAAGVRRIIEKFGFPLLLKPRVGFTSKNVFVARSEKEIAAACVLVPDLIAQRYLANDLREYTAGTVSGTDGKVRGSIILHRDLNMGTTYRTELTRDKGMTEQVVAITEKLGAVGVCNLQFRVIDGKVYVFEINPRFSGTCGIRYLYGFNDPEMVFDLFKLNIDVKQPELRNAVVLRYWNEISIPEADFELLRSGRKKHAGVQSVISVNVE